MATGITNYRRRSGRLAQLNNTNDKQNYLLQSSTKIKKRQRHALEDISNQQPKKISKKNDQKQNNTDNLLEKKSSDFSLKEEKEVQSIKIDSINAKKMGKEKQKPLSKSSSQEGENNHTEIRVVDPIYNSSHKWYQDDVEDIDTRELNRLPDYHKYLQDVQNHWKNSEEKYIASFDYLNERNLTVKIRTILIDWMIEVCEEFERSNKVLFLAVHLLEKALSCFAVSRENLQLVSCCCLLLASKFEDTDSLDVRDVIRVSNKTYRTYQVIMMESKILRHLNHNVVAVTAATFLKRFTEAAKDSSYGVFVNIKDEEIEYLSEYLVRLSLFSEMITKCRPSQITAAAVYLARMLITPTCCPHFGATLHHVTGYTPDELKDTALELLELYENEISKHEKDQRIMAVTQYFLDVSCPYSPLTSDQFLKNHEYTIQYHRNQCK